MRICLGYRLHFLVDIVPQNYVLQPKVRCRSQREMADYHPIRLTPMLMQNHHICQPFSLAQVDQVLNDIPTPVDSFGVGEQHSDFFLELE